MSESQNVKIEVYGKEYTIRSSEGSEVTQRYAKYIDETMKEISHKTGAFDATKIATLALLQITHELFVLRNQHSSNEADFSVRMIHLNEKIDAALADSTQSGTGTTS